MSLEKVQGFIKSAFPSATSSTSMVAHPLDPPTAVEMTTATSTLRPWFSENGVKAFKFLTVQLKEPPKAAVLAALSWTGAPAAASVAPIERVMEPEIKSIIKLGKGVQPTITPEELCLAEQNLRKDERVVKLVADVGNKPEQLYADGWSIGYDRRFGDKRIQQCLLYARFNEHDNMYVHPMDFIPVLETSTGKLLAIDFPNHRTTADKTLSTGTTAPPEGISFKDPKVRYRIPPLLEPFEFLPDFAKAEMRKDLKPIHVTQPEGVSFKRTGNMLEWSNFKVHVGFYPREGLAFSTISYKDADRPGASIAKPEERPLFYRMSLTEMWLCPTQRPPGLITGNLP